MTLDRWAAPGAATSVAASSRPTDLSRRLSVAVVGGGPAGSTTAAILGRRGHRVTIIDRAEFPRDKVCGDAIVPKAAVELSRLSLSRVLELRPQLNGSYYVIPRREFDAALLQEARDAGAFVVTGKVEEVERTGDGRWMVHLDSGVAFSGSGFDVVVGADGAQSAVRRSVLRATRDRSGDESAFAFRQYFSVSTAPAGLSVFSALDGESLRAYGWAFRVSPGLINVGYARFGRGASRGLRTSFERFTRELMVGEGRDWRATPLDRPLAGEIRFDFDPGLASDLLLVGDAAGLSSPVIGEGISFAVRSGDLAAQTICSYAEGRCELSEYWRAVDGVLGEEIRRELQFLRGGR